MQIESESILVPPCVFELALGAGTTYRFVFSRFLNFRVFTWTEYSLIPARSRDHTGLWLLSVAKLIAKVRTFAADFCSKESPAEPMTGKPLQNLRVLRRLC